ncbi:hypothetical protein MRS76_12920 [Rhizobiaceae bacterium n13]|uniref:Pentapeptide MXKDX repeat protein n=1 Tax=Ferirhizobium litorale TaxID=2927786 RepID=A0AAE3QIC7_9HYPH|nr:hypothetical protein [Fererhizobium litorale]MDI7862860.1 hypothetical protein [Fererhizobium litorale]MDI7923946.1 hypothetical protein [Fererhizobium litorale]
MNSFASRAAVCAFLVAVSAAAPGHAEDMKKSDILQTDTMSSDAMPTAGTKADCMQKAEMEMESMKKDEMMKACDAMK